MRCSQFQMIYRVKTDTPEELWREIGTILQRHGFERVSYIDEIRSMNEGCEEGEGEEIDERMFAHLYRKREPFTGECNLSEFTMERVRSKRFIIRSTFCGSVRYLFIRNYLMEKGVEYVTAFGSCVFTKSYDEYRWEFPGQWENAPFVQIQSKSGVEVCIEPYSTWISFRHGLYDPAFLMSRIEEETEVRWDPCTILRTLDEICP